jgi:hypothetical protein
MRAPKGLRSTTTASVGFLARRLSLLTTLRTCRSPRLAFPFGALGESGDAPRSFEHVGQLHEALGRSKVARVPGERRLVHEDVRNVESKHGLLVTYLLSGPPTLQVKRGTGKNCVERYHYPNHRLLLLARIVDATKLHAIASLHKPLFVELGDAFLARDFTQLAHDPTE